MFITARITSVFVSSTTVHISNDFHIFSLRYWDVVARGLLCTDCKMLIIRNHEPAKVKINFMYNLDRFLTLLNNCSGWCFGIE